MRSLWTFGFVLAPLAASATIDYSVKVEPDAKQLKVTVSFVAKSGKTNLHIPRWSPGSYNLANLNGRVQGIAVSGENSPTIAPVPDDLSSWTVTSPSGKRVSVTYALTTTVADDRIHYSGASTYLYVEGRKEEDCHLSLDMPTGWKSYCGLDASGGKDSYVAPTYDVLADNPVSAGVLTTDTYTSHGVGHTIVYHSGDPSKLNRANVIAACKFVSDSEGDFFGGLPFKKYVWHFTVFDAPDGGWGLEHLASTEIGLATGLGTGTKSVLAHEYFHAWNVKRIRSSVLGPFDYTKVPKTGALWWLEGVTDYYAWLLPTRYGMFNEDTFYGDIVKNTQTTRAEKARMEVSPYDSSYRVGEANNGRGNSSGYMVNYYNTGWLLGMCLDIEIRTSTGGAKSLDDVEMELWKQCRNNQPGFPEDGIRKALVKVAGQGLGTAYDKWVIAPGELPVEAQLSKVGLAMTTSKEDYVDAGFDVMGGFGGFRVRRVRDSASSQLQERDQIVAINGEDVSGMSGREAAGYWQKIASSAKAGDDIKLKIKRDQDEKDVELKFVTSSRDVVKVQKSPLSTPEQDKLRKAWLTGGKSKLPYSG